MANANRKLQDTDMLTVEEFAAEKGVSYVTVYRTIKTPETPKGRITAELGDSDRWIINWGINKNVHFRNYQHRTKNVPKEQPAA